MTVNPSEPCPHCGESWGYSRIEGNCYACFFGPEDQSEEAEMRTFWLNRVEDETGVSGTGRVACGVEFPNGKVAVSWLTKVTSVAVYDDIEAVVAIHGHGGKTVVEWTEGSIESPWAAQDDLVNALEERNGK